MNVAYAENRKDHVSKKEKVFKVSVDGVKKRRKKMKCTDKTFPVPTCIHGRVFDCKFTVNVKMLKVKKFITTSLSVTSVQYIALFFFSNVCAMISFLNYFLAGRVPRKYSIYWDAEIPTEYYEESFLKFEESLDFSSIQDDSGCEDLYAKSEFALQKFRKYEKDLIKGDQKKCRRYTVADLRGA